MGHFIDIDRWKRREHFHHFRDMRLPFFSVCADIDVTRLRERCRSENRSFFLASLFHMLRAANDTEPMRLRLRGERVWLHDRVSVSSTVPRPDETFGCVRLDAVNDPAVFETQGLAAIEECRRGGPAFPDGEDDVIYHSTLPWIRFVSRNVSIAFSSCGRTTSAREGIVQARI